jgi:hypothetical protein
LEGALGAVARTRVEAVVAVAGVEAVAAAVVEAAGAEVEAAVVVEAAGAEVEAAEVVEEPAGAVEEEAVGAGRQPRAEPRVDRSQRPGSIVPRSRPSCPRSIPRSL